MLKNQKFPKLIPLLIWPILASVGSFALHANVLVSIILFFGVPATYLSFLRRSAIKKSALFSVAMAIPVAIIVDYVMEHTRGWFLPHSVFGSFRLFGYVTLEQHIWLFFYVYFVILFYEVFFERHARAQRLFAPRLKYLVYFLFALLGLFLVILATRGALLHINFFYLKFGIVAAGLPIVFALFRMPRLMGKFLKAGLYFSVLSLIYEVTALKLGQWTFPATNEFIGAINILGVSFPFEELFFWILLGPIATLAYYEFFDDDRR